MDRREPRIHNPSSSAVPCAFADHSRENSQLALFPRQASGSAPFDLISTFENISPRWSRNLQFGSICATSSGGRLPRTGFSRLPLLPSGH